MIIQTKYGKIEGIQKDGYDLYLGIPYAKPPVGDFRWKPPVEMEAWDEIYQAKAFPTKSMQPVNGSGGFYDKEFRDDETYITKSSEDCLYLNIWTPVQTCEALQSGEKLPVAIYIHGGAFLGGNGHEKEFDGQVYCENGVILVTLNYRLGIFGFLAHPWLSAESEHHVSGNYGILDQLAALKWVYENIEAFGGDPSKITVMGQSAGSMSTQTLISSKLSDGMIAGAIMQSGSGYKAGLNRDDFTLEVLEGFGLEFSKLAGVSSLDEMRKLTTEQVMALFDPFMGSVMPKSHGLFLVPAIDGYVLEAGYDQLINEGKIKNIPYMIGSTGDDILVTEELKEKGEYCSLYYGSIDFSLINEKTMGMPSYVYFFDRKLPGDDAGAFHSSELWYMFGTLKRAWRPFEEHDYDLSKEMVTCWTNFIKTGNPNGKNMSTWQPCTQENQFVKLFK